MKLPFFSIIYFLLIGTTYCQTWLDDSCPLDKKIRNEDYSSAKPNNTLTLILNQEGDLLINNKKSDGLSEIKFKETVYEFLSNPSKDKTKADSPKQGIIALGSYGEHELYNLILKYVREVYLYAWDTAAKEKYDETYVNLNCKKRTKVRKSGFHYNVLELSSEKEKKPKITIGVPPFKGDVIDN